MTEYTIDGEGAISSVLSGTEFRAYDAGGSARTKKATAAQIAIFVLRNTGARISACGAVRQHERAISLAHPRKLLFRQEHGRDLRHDHSTYAQRLHDQSRTSRLTVLSRILIPDHMVAGIPPAFPL